MKRKTPDLLIENPFIKPENRFWNVDQPVSLKRSVSPPPSIRRRTNASEPTTAAVEACKEDVEDRLSFFSQKLLEARRPQVAGEPRLNHQAWINLYTRNGNDQGHHFVIHQHDHPIAGTHYDLRLQCNATSSISFAIMYGLPGDPNSKRLNRNATETRVHTLWNHLIETASHQTGSMLIWDTGEYTILPFHDRHKDYASADGSDLESGSNADRSWSFLSESQKLHQAFSQRKIRLRLHGTRLPKGYTISLRLTAENFQSEQPNPPKRRRRDKGLTKTKSRSQTRYDYNTTDSEADSQPSNITPSKSPRSTLKKTLSSMHRLESPPPSSLSLHSQPKPDPSYISTSVSPSSTPSSPQSNVQEREPPALAPSNPQEIESQIHLTNAYPTATNTINSVHQRKWFLSLDRSGSGFTKQQRQQTYNDSHSSTTATITITWTPCVTTPNSLSPSGFKPFYVQGRDIEKSILTGRTASEVLSDEGVMGYVPRGGWRAVLD